MKFFNSFKIYPSKKDSIILLKKLFLFYLIVLSMLFIFQRKVMYLPDKDMSISTHWIPLLKDNKIIALKEKDKLNSYNVFNF